MKRYDLLFRYLDGEITRDEDKTLREIIKDDPKLGTDFQSFLEIDYQINKINNEMEYPDDFIDEIGMKISNRIVLDNELKLMRKEVRKQYATRFVLVPAIIAAFFFTFLISVQNPEINLLSLPTGNPETNTISNKPPENENISRFSAKVKKQEKFITNSEKLIENKSSESIITIESENNLSNSNSDFSKIISAHSDTFNNENNVKLTQQSQKEDEPILQNNIVSKPVINNNASMQLDAPSLNYFSSEEFLINPIIQNFTSNIFQASLINNSNIEINSLLGSDIAQIGVNSSNQIVNSFTQSFSAEVSSGSSLGLETGYIEFKAKTKKITEISSKTKTGGLNGFTILEQNNNSSENPVLIRVEGIEATNHRMFWVGLFFEKNFLNYDDINISSRISLGASDNGVISSLKLLAKYNLTKGIILTLGTDAKIFEGSFNENKINRINSAFSLVYGVKFTF